jgi:hypothetical protein
MLKADSTGWLLEEDNPSVRYFALTDILNKDDCDQEVREAKAAIMHVGVVPQILAEQKPQGHWGVAEDFYVRSKYRGTVWTFLLLAELGADGADPRIKRACEFVLEHSQNRESGAFSHRGSETGGGSRDVVPCLTGNMIYSLIRFGYLDDPRVQRGIDWIVTYQRFDDGEGEAPKGWPYGRGSCFGRHSCHMGVVKALKALAEIPTDERSGGVKDTIDKGAEYLLKHHIYKRSHDLSRVSKANWVKLGFPLMWNTDALEILGILAKLGYKDERMRDAFELVLSKQDSEGRWKLENTYNGRSLVNIERKGKPSKWVTLNALIAIKQFCSQ